MCNQKLHNIFVTSRTREMERSSFVFVDFVPVDLLSGNLFQFLKVTVIRSFEKFRKFTYIFILQSIRTQIFNRTGQPVQTERRASACQTRGRGSIVFGGGTERRILLLDG